MKTKQAIAVLIIGLGLLAASVSRAATITATGSGNWTSTIPDAPWPGGIVPQTTDNAEIDTPFNVSVDSTATIDYIFGTGTVTMTKNSTLNIVGTDAGEGTQSLATLDTSATNNTVNYEGNAFWCKHQNYYNLVLGGFGTLYNGEIGVSGDGAAAMTIAGNLTLGGTANVQQAASFTVNGNMIVGPGSTFDASCSPVTVLGNTIVSGTLVDFCGQSAAQDDVLNNVAVTPGGKWHLQDVVEWAITGNLTNHGDISGFGFSSITFNGTGVIAGDPLTIPTLTINGSSTIATTVTVTTNTPGLNGTLVFDLAHKGEMIVPSFLGQQLFFGGTLDVVNTGAAPTPGFTYQLFLASGYNDPFSFGTINLPTLPGALTWVNNLTTSGSLSVSGVSTPTITPSFSGNLWTLSWDSGTFPGYSVQGQTNANGIRNNWGETGSGTVSPFLTTISTNNPSVFFRLHQ